jgi:branched-chain amino acid transport system ATP-binding protein
MTTPTAPGPLLETQGLTKSFHGLLALSNVSVAVREGEILGIIGPNGAGKTTLFNLISGALAPTAGRVLHRGRDVTGLPVHRIARLGIARTFQSIRLFREMTVLENVMVGRHARARSGLADALLRTCAMRREEAALREAALRHLSVLGLAERAGEMAGGLTTGQQRLLEVARALASEPELLLLDEPAAGLNTRETEALAEFIRGIPGALASAVVLIEHDMRLLMSSAHRVVVLDRGVEIAEGAPSEIQGNPEVIAAYLGERFLERARGRAGGARGGTA